jgi:hypothetical protein
MAKQTKPTPGPWTRWTGHAEVYSGVKENTPTSLRGHLDKPFELVARCDDNDLDEDEQAANASLVAAAPDMLAALESAVFEFSFHGLDKTIAAQNVRAAIAKAKGA